MEIIGAVAVLINLILWLSAPCVLLYVAYDYMAKNVSPVLGIFCFVVAMYLIFIYMLLWGMFNED